MRGGFSTTEWIAIILTMLGLVVLVVIAARIFGVYA